VNILELYQLLVKVYLWLITYPLFDITGSNST